MDWLGIVYIWAADIGVDARDVNLDVDFSDTIDKLDLSAGETEGTWSLGAFGSYTTGRHHFYAGYRHLEMNLKGGSGESVTETYSGPAIAYGFSF